MSMPRVAPAVPSDSDLLCEGCGYILNGLPDDNRCPECGKPVAESSTDNARVPPAWERGVQGLFSTTIAVLFWPTRFFRSMTTRASLHPAWQFANVHWLLSAVLAGIGIYRHLQLQWAKFLPYRFDVILIVLIYVAILVTTLVAGKLTAWEAAYRGLRMPWRAVLRALYYHGAHYLPVAVLLFVTTVGFDRAIHRGWFGADSIIPYLYILSGEVVIGAIYLFWTYWIAMRNIMYANR
jgi:hypothetical protein